MAQLPHYSLEVCSLTPASLTGPSGTNFSVCREIRMQTCSRAGRLGPAISGGLGRRMDAIAHIMGWVGGSLCR